MARKPPRRRGGTTPRTPGPKRTRTAPGQGRAPARTAARGATPGGAGSAHGARAPKPPGTTAVRRASASRAAARPARPTTPKKAARSEAPPARPASRRTRFTPPEPARVAALLGILDRLYPEARCELDFDSPLHLLVATILSAQCTDERVNKTTPGLFARFPDAPALAGADPDELEALIRSTGFYRMKAKAILSCCADIVAKHGGQVPRTMEALTALRGVGRKTANVVLGNAYGIPGLVVDTHVTRLSHRLGLTDEEDAVRIEFALQPIVPEPSWTVFSHWLILHGRRVCVARKPRCSVCPLAPHCPRLGVTASQ
jgi:endonuclease III